MTQWALQFRGRGVASHLMSALAGSPHAAEAVCIMVCPKPIEMVDDEETWKMQTSVAVKFFMKVWHHYLFRRPYMRVISWTVLALPLWRSPLLIINGCIELLPQNWANVLLSVCHRRHPSLPLHPY